MDAVDQRRRRARVARRALGEGASRTSRRAGSRISQRGSRPTDPFLGPVVRARAGRPRPQLGAEGLGALEVAHQQAAQHQQAVAAADPLGGRVGVPAPPRDRHAAGHRGRSRLRQVSAHSPGELAIGVEEPDCLDCALAAGTREPPAGVENSETKATVSPSIPA